MIKKSLQIFIFILILALSFFFRKQDYAQIPIPGQSTDEYSNSWVGLSLIQAGMPIGISGLPNYTHEFKKYINVDRFTQVISSDALTLNYPWMDHPPLLGLITGGYAYTAGARVFEDTTALLIRRPIIVITTLSVAFLMIFAWINMGYIAAVISGLIYGTTPLVVLSSRMIQSENAIIPSFLLTLIFTSLYLKSKKDLWLILAALASGLATLFKLTGFVCYLFVILALLFHYQQLSKKFFQDSIFFIMVALPVSLLFVVYGLAFGYDNFFSILFSNANRFYGIGPGAIFDLIRQQRLTQHKFLPEIWIISGWIVALIYLFWRPKKTSLNLLLLAFLSLLITYIFFGSQPYGWYSFPFWPILILLLSDFLTSVFRNQDNLVPVFLFSVMIFGANISRVIGIFEFQPYALWWRFGVSGLLFIFIVGFILKLKSKLITHFILPILWLAAIYLNILYLQGINIDFWWQNIS